MVSLESVITELANAPELWWGYTREHGWVVLDHDDAQNTGDPRYLVRCRDWVQIEVSRADFASDRFKSWKNYIGQLPDDQAQQASSQLIVFHRECMSRVAGFRVVKAGSSKEGDRKSNGNHAKNIMQRGQQIFLAPCPEYSYCGIITGVKVTGQDGKSRPMSAVASNSFITYQFKGEADK